MNFFILLILAIIFIIIYIYYQKLISEEEKDKKVNHILEKKIFGEIIDQNIFDAINLIKSKSKKTSEDYYKLGTLYLCHLNDLQKGFKSYNIALKYINNEYIDLDDKVILLDKIENIIRRTALANISCQFISNKLLSAIQNLQDKIHFDRMNKIFKDKIKHIQNTRTSNTCEIPELKINNNKIKLNRVNKKVSNITKKLNSRRKWSTDPQNVHSSLIMQDMKSQFNYIKTQNNIKNVPIYTFDMLKNNLLVRSNNDSRVKNVLDRLNSNSKILNIDGVGERDLLIEVYRRINSTINTKNKYSLIDALITSLIDCTNGSSLVCPTGRQTRIMSSLAILDADSESRGIGILKNKEAVRNEIFDESAKIVEKFIGENSSTPKNIIDEYNKGLRTEEVLELEQKIKNDIKGLKYRYTGKLPDKSLNQLIDECIAVV